MLLVEQHIHKALAGRRPCAGDDEGDDRARRQGERARRRASTTSKTRTCASTRRPESRRTATTKQSGGTAHESTYSERRAASACLIAAFALSARRAAAAVPRAATGSCATGTTAPSKPCPGTPLKFTSIIALSGPLGTRRRPVADGIDAAVDGVNRTCTLGRPLQVTICDDKDDTNANLACGRKAGSDGSLAILGSIGSFDDGVTASKLPAIFVNGTSPFELTNKNAYSSVNGIALGISGTSAIKARGRKSSTLVLPDTPTLQFAGQPDREDGRAARASRSTRSTTRRTRPTSRRSPRRSRRSNDEAVGMLPLNPVVVVNALAQEGITPDNHDMVDPGRRHHARFVEATRQRRERDARRERGDAADGDEQQGDRGVPRRHEGRRQEPGRSERRLQHASRRGRT